jgi:hypothetical protein
LCVTEKIDGVRVGGACICHIEFDNEKFVVVTQPMAKLDLTSPLTSKI